jgi:hypothetical protein
MKLPGWAFVLGVPLVGACVLHHPLGALDAWLQAGGLFPASVAKTGLSSIAAGGLLAACWRWPEGRVRAGVGLVLGALLATGAVWALRYMVWHTFGAQTEARISGGTATRFALMQWGASVLAGGLGGALAGMRIHKPKHLLLHLGGLVLALLASEGIVGGLGIDTQLMNKALYYQTVEIEVHTPVDDAVLLYALKPSTTHGGEGPWGIRDVRINSHGARGPEYPGKKAPGTKRVLFFGGSTLYGAGVGNRDTTPAVLERLLRQDHPATEVWNFGACAYNTAQSTRLASMKLGKLDPDLILVLITNTGRRAFMGGPQHQGDDKSSYFEANPWLYLENFPPTRLAEGTHWALLRHSSLYRSYAAWARMYTDPDTTYADKADQEQVRALLAAAEEAGVEVVWVLSPSRGSEISAADLGVQADRWIDLNIPGRGGDYTQAHPSPTVLAEYAATIADSLQRGPYGLSAETTDQ